jgi:hypothetical protein
MKYFIDNTRQPKAVFCGAKFQQAGYKLGVNKGASLNRHIVILDAQKAKLHADTALFERLHSAEKLVTDGTYSTEKMLNFRNDVLNKKVNGYVMGFAAVHKTPIEFKSHNELGNIVSTNKVASQFKIEISISSGLTRSALAIASTVPQLPVLIDESTAHELMTNNLCCAKFGYPSVSELFDKHSAVYKIFCNALPNEDGQYPFLNPC